MQKDLEGKEKKIAQEHDEAKRKAQEMLLKAQHEAEAMKVDIITHAQQERDAAIAQARQRAEEIIQQADKSRHQMLSELDQRIARESVLKAVELVREALPDEFRRAVHETWTNNLLTHGFDALSRIPAPADNDAVRIISAFELTDAQRDILRKKIKESFGKSISFKEECDPSLVAGVMISIGSTELDGSLRNKISEKAR
jgi:hypothetical protein